MLRDPHAWSPQRQWEAGFTMPLARAEQRGSKPRVNPQSLAPHPSAGGLPWGLALGHPPWGASPTSRAPVHCSGQHSITVPTALATQLCCPRAVRSRRTLFTCLCITCKINYFEPPPSITWPGCRLGGEQGVRMEEGRCRLLLGKQETHTLARTDGQWPRRCPWAWFRPARGS